MSELVQVEVTLAGPRMTTRFDYSLIDEAYRDEVQTAARSIHQLGKGVGTGIIAIGKRLIEVKGMIPHGQFTVWIEGEFGLSERVAQNYMNVAREFGEGQNRINCSVFNPSVLYLLAAPSTPEEVREKVEVTFRETGEMPTRAEIKALRDAHKKPTPTLAKPTYLEPTPEPKVDLPADLVEAGVTLGFDGTSWGYVIPLPDGDRATGYYPSPDAAIASARESLRLRQRKPQSVVIETAETLQPSFEELEAIAEVEQEREEEEAERLAIEEPTLDPVPSGANQPRHAVLEEHKPAPQWMKEYLQKLVDMIKHQRKLRIVVAPNAFFDNMPKSHGGADGAMMMLADGSDVIIMPERAVETQYWRDVIAHEFAHVIHAQVDRMVTSGHVDFDAYETEIERFAYLVGGMMAFAILHGSFNHKGRRLEL